jgi:CBS domain-containing protein
MTKNQQGRRPAIEGIPNKLLMRFFDDLSSARGSALADAEAFGPLLAAIEGIGARLAKNGHGLAHYKAEIRQLVPQGDSTEFDRVFEVMREGRNEAVHTGGAARHLTQSCIRLALMLEAGIRERVGGPRSDWTVGDVMVKSVHEVHPWESVRDARVRMLENAFSYLPMLKDDKWLMVSDLAVAQWLLRPKDETPMNCTMDKLANALTLPEAPLLPHSVKIHAALSELEKRHLPGLVVEDTGTAQGRSRLLGMITPFDAL